MDTSTALKRVERYDQCVFNLEPHHDSDFTIQEAGGDPFIGFYEISPSRTVDGSQSPLPSSTTATSAGAVNSSTIPYGGLLEWQRQQELANNRTGHEPPILSSILESQSEPSAPSTSAKSRRRYGPEVWVQFRPVVQNLYMIQGLTLCETQRILDEIYNFKASKKQLKDRVKKWGFVKNKKGGVGSSSHKSTFLESGNDVDGSLRSKSLSPNSIQE